MAASAPRTTATLEPWSGKVAPLYGGHAMLVSSMTGRGALTATSVPIDCANGTQTTSRASNAIVRMHRPPASMSQRRLVAAKYLQRRSLHGVGQYTFCRLPGADPSYALSNALAPKLASNQTIRPVFSACDR